MNKSLVRTIALFAFLTGSIFAQENKFHFQVGSVAKIIGTEEFQISQSPDLYRVTGTLRVKTDNGALVVNYELSLTSDFKLVRYKMENPEGGSIQVWREGDSVQISLDGIMQKRTKTLPFTPSMVILDSAIGHFQAILDRGRANSPSTSSLTLLNPQALMTIPGTISRNGDEPAMLDGQPIRTQKYTLTFAQGSVEYWADETGRLMRVQAPGQKVEYDREGFVLEQKPKNETAPQNGEILPPSLDGGLNRIGGTRLLLRVVTDDAQDQELMRDKAALEHELRMRKISYDASRKAESKSIEVSGIDSVQDHDFRYICNALYRTKYSLQSTTADGKITYLLSLNIRQVREATVKQAAETIGRRLDALGVRQPVVQILNGDAGEIPERLLVELPGVKDAGALSI